MPYSRDVFDRDCLALIEKLPVRTCLDIGAGAGKHGRMVRLAHPKAQITGVEIVSDYIPRFKLEQVYDAVRNCDVLELLKNPDAHWDLAIFGDVLEHMRKSDGGDLLHFFLYRTKWALVVYPTRFPQDSVEGYKSEAHRSFWWPSDFAGFDHVLRERSQKVAVAIDGLLRRGGDPSVRDIWK